MHIDWVSPGHHTAKKGIRKHAHVRREGCFTHVTCVKVCLDGLNMFGIELIQLVCFNIAKYLFPVSKCYRGCPGNTWHVRHAHHRSILGKLRSRTNQAHVPAQNVIELRKFIQFEFAQEPANRCNSQVTLSGETGA